MVPTNAIYHYNLTKLIETKLNDLFYFKQLNLA